MWTRLRLRRIPRVRQHDQTDCGAACLASVAQHYGLRLPIARIRQLASTDRDGTNVLGMVEAAERLGFLAKGVKGSPYSLHRIPKPAIAHLELPNGLHHYVVLFDATTDLVTYMDPADGEVHRVPAAEFLALWTGVLLLLVPGERFEAVDHRTGGAARFWKLLRPHRTVMTQALFGATIYTLLGLTTAIYVQKLVDHVLVDGNRSLLNLLSVVMLALLAAQVYIGSMKDLLTLRTGQKIDATLILGYYRHLLTLPQRFFDTWRVGEIISRVNDAVKIRAFINDVSLDLVVNCMVVVFSFALMFVYSWKLALVMLAVIPLYGAIYWVTNRINSTNQRRMMESAAELETHLVESLNRVGTIKRFGVEEGANLLTEQRFVRLLGTVYRSGSTDIFASNASDFASRLFTIILLWTGAGFVIKRDLTPGELMSFYALIGYLTGPISSLIGANRTVQDALIAADRLFEILDLDREESVQHRVELTAAAVGTIRFEAVRFRYGTRNEVFDGLDLVIPHGSVTAIVGESGSGKSTLASLLHKLYPLDSGRIRIGSLDLDHISSESLRRLVGVVPQDVQLFSGDLIQNIALGDPEPDVERVLNVCARIGLEAFLDSLPAGLHTRLGEDGVGLSGGQKQRIAIARALYRDPAILILDEASASLDAVSEHCVQRAVRTLRFEGKTIVLIAHRLSTVQQADRIVVLHGGRVVEDGTHAELMRAEGAYWRLWAHQFPSFTDVLGRKVTTSLLIDPGFETLAGTDPVRRNGDASRVAYG
jgi:ATP-binding cassette, subfamily C, bacteriocin exporter